MQSGNSEEVGSVVAQAATDARGKHWISAELKRLDQETRFLEVNLYIYIHTKFLLVFNGVCFVV